MTRVSPQISVVMSVYNGADTLDETVESILTQEDVDLEYIIVNDGSTDGTAEILDQYARSDSRVIVIHQENRGLTRSLIRGCAKARGEFIARQDAGDVSLPGRLSRQIKLFSKDENVVMVSCGTRFVGPEGEFLYDVMQTDESSNTGLRVLEIDKISGPSSHGAVMFRRSAYLAVGGYRAEFKYAQDLDLWVRLAELGDHRVLPAICFQASYFPGTISAEKRTQQIENAKLIIECTKRRRAGKDEKPILDKAIMLESVSKKSGNVRSRESEFYYFIAACLSASNRKKSNYYYRKSLKCNPLNFKSLFRLVCRI